MHTNLMGTTCLQLKLQQGIITKPFHHMKMGYSMLAVTLLHCVHFAIMRVPSNRRVNCPLIMIHITVYECKIFTCHRMFLKLGRQ
ncbi:hypothetical protein D3C73_1503420 [compost metagenome]